MRRRVAGALDGLLETPRPGDIKKLEGMGNEFRLRIGDWRVIFRPEPEQFVVVILAVRHRSSAYRD
jgi:mRNA interferase RelE/StbE